MVSGVPVMCKSAKCNWHFRRPQRFNEVRLEVRDHPGTSIAELSRALRNPSDSAGRDRDQADTGPGIAHAKRVGKTVGELIEEGELINGGETGQGRRRLDLPSRAP